LTHRKEKQNKESPLTSWGCRSSQ